MSSFSYMYHWTLGEMEKRDEMSVEIVAALVQYFIEHEQELTGKAGKCTKQVCLFLHLVPCCRSMLVLGVFVITVYYIYE